MDAQLEAEAKEAQLLKGLQLFWVYVQPVELYSEIAKRQKRQVLI